MHSAQHILVAAADPLVAELFAELLPARGYRFEVAHTAKLVLVALERGGHDLVIVDDGSPGLDPQAIIWRVREQARDLDVILCSQRPVPTAVIGAYDLITLPSDSMDAVMFKIDRALERRRERVQNRRMTGYLTQADAQLESVNRALETLLAERTRQLTYLAEANAQIEELNQRMAQLLGERNKQVTYLAQANDQVDHLNRALEGSVHKQNKQLEYLGQANAQIEEMNQRLDQYVAERTRALTEANERLHEMTLTDELTGLYNQRWLRARLEEEYQRAVRHSQALAVLMIDIDKFKSVNDEHDHIFGSAVLRRVGELLRQHVRGIDVAVRYGGDEFCVILPQTSLGGAVAVAERLRVAAARADMGDEGSPYKLTLSIGVAAVGECKADSGIALLQAADRALYAAKDNGRNRVAAMNGLHPVTSVG